MYTPSLPIVPTVASPPVTPLTCQVTAVLPALLIVATNTWVPDPATREAFAGDTETLSGAAAVNVTVADPDCVPSAAETAVMVIVAGEGMTAGDRYWPDDDIVPTTLSALLLAELERGEVVPIVATIVVALIN